MENMGKVDFFFCFFKFLIIFLLILEYMTKMYEIFSIISSLLHGKSLISTQGMATFQLFINNFSTNTKNPKGIENQSKLELIKTNDFEAIKNLITSICKNQSHHPKLSRLKDLLSDFFNSEEAIKNHSKAIIFTQNRNTAQEISYFINKDQNIKSALFIGQSGRVSKKKQAEKEGLSFLSKYNPSFKKQDQEKCPGMSQKEQIKTIKDFKESKLNCLIATCIGEEGLDIGDVDLIVCYDSGFSPIRMIQRKGRTGRFRNGKVVVLLMEGKEENAYRQHIKKGEGLVKVLKKCSLLKLDEKGKNKEKLRFFSFNPRMIPDGVNPILRMEGYLLNEGEWGNEEEEEEKKGEKNCLKGKKKGKKLYNKKKKVNENSINTSDKNYNVFDDNTVDTNYSTFDNTNNHIINDFIYNENTKGSAYEIIEGDTKENINSKEECFNANEESFDSIINREIDELVDDFELTQNFENISKNLNEEEVKEEDEEEIVEKLLLEYEKNLKKRKLTIDFCTESKKIKLDQPLYIQK